MWIYLCYTQSEEAIPIDQFLVCGDDYKIIRDAVAKGIMDCKVDGLDKICEVTLLTCW